MIFAGKTRADDENGGVSLADRHILATPTAKTRLKWLEKIDRDQSPAIGEGDLKSTGSGVGNS